MIVFLVGTSLLVGTGFGWQGHKVKLRIDVWGRNANASDEIFQAADAGKTLRGDWKQIPGDDSSLSSLNPSHMRP